MPVWNCLPGWISAVAIALSLIWGMDVCSAAGPTQDDLDRAGSPTDSWLMANKSYDGHRYVNLDQINVQNAANLREVCNYDTQLAAPAQASPVLYQGRLYFTAGPFTVALIRLAAKRFGGTNGSSKPNRFRRLTVELQSRMVRSFVGQPMDT